MQTNDIKAQLINARDEYIDALRGDLLGPGSEMDYPDRETELISGAPVERYSVGILFPQGNMINLENDDTKPAETFETDDENEESSSPEDSQLTIEKDNEATSFSSSRSQDSEDSIEEDINIAAQYMPSSMGLSFVVNRDLNNLSGKIEFATYAKIKSFSDIAVRYVPLDENFSLPNSFTKIVEYKSDEHIIVAKDAFESKDLKTPLSQASFSSSEEEFRFKTAVYHLALLLQNGYRRVPHEYDFDFAFDNSGEYRSVGLIDGVDARISAKKIKLDNNKYSITLMFTNNLHKRADSAYCIFQSKIIVDSKKNDFRFIDVKPDNYSCDDDEKNELDMLYNSKKSYGSGLGVSVDWDIKNGEGKIWTEYIPVHEVPAMDFNLCENNILSNDKLSMKYLSDLDDSDRDEKINALRALVSLYSDWIKGLELSVDKLGGGFSKVAHINIKNCRQARDRMLAGIDKLSSDDQVYNAFQLANRAMFMQRVHVINRKNISRMECLPENKDFCKTVLHNYNNESDSDCKWRPFQIAFILMNIEAIVDDDSDFRKNVDLIWFPTGGGKTEAYLGLTALTIFYRRLVHLPISDGTVVIMRYTLRLLTAQQFERASTLICACEYIRRDCLNYKSLYKKYDLGKSPITIGLWIGGDHTPNKNADAKECLKYLDDITPGTIDSIKEKNCKFQLLSCPWCGCRMTRESHNGSIVGKWGYKMKNGHFYMACPNISCCPFRDILPVQVVDEELYLNPPTLLFATVDKFAMMAWNEKTGGFFATGLNNNNRAPELIIQDELHLISGSLGTIIGEYETAIDALCSQKGILPKIVASTATIRRAAEQCINLYNRNVTQFPAPGLDASDSFFAREKKIDYDKHSYGRKYIGILPSGKTKAMIEIRTMSSLAQRLAQLDYPDEIIDKFYTITAYFNSLRDLGKTATLVGDDISNYMKRICDRTLLKRRFINRANELTSRVTTTRLNETLDALEKNNYGSNQDGKYPVGVLLATNMISVGIDVPRLNTMIIVGQPKLTSEYIQATSRVGREYPGMVVGLYDATRSRDRSHYEHFRAYHESFYRYVEPTSVTPFSIQARERALHAAIIAIFRQQNTGISGEKEAAGFSIEAYHDTISKIKNYIINRINNINNGNPEGTYVDTTDVASEIDEFFRYWDEKARRCRNEGIVLKYGQATMSNIVNKDCDYLLKVYKQADYINAIDTLNSMRNVDKSINGVVLEWGDIGGNK